MSTSAQAYDVLAEALKELHGRFGDTLFADRRRMVSLLSDMLPEAKRDIRLVAAAADEGVPAAIASAEPHMLGVELDRQASKLEGSTGLQRELACHLVRVFAYATGKGPLPSVYGGTPVQPVQPVPPGPSDWAGLSVPVGPPPQPSHYPGGQSYYPTPTPPPPAPLLTVGGFAVQKSHLVGIVGAGLAVLAATQLIGGEEEAPIPDAGNEVVPVNPEPDPQPVRPVTPTNGGGTFAEETRDFGIAAKNQLESNVGSPTPLDVPNGRRVTTGEVQALVRDNRQAILVDVLANPHSPTIQGARYIPAAGLPGSFDDQNQRQTEAELERVTGGDKGRPLIFFCAGPICWESYNAVLRAARAGYTDLYWYRGGLAAWQQAGLPMEPLQAPAANFSF